MKELRKFSEAINENVEDRQASMHDAWEEIKDLLPKGKVKKLEKQFDEYDEEFADAYDEDQGEEEDVLDDWESWLEDVVAKYKLDVDLDSILESRVDENIDSEDIIALDDYDNFVANSIKDAYYAIGDHLPGLVNDLDATVDNFPNWKEELKIFKQIQKLFYKSKIGKFM